MDLPNKEFTDEKGNVVVREDDSISVEVKGGDWLAEYGCYLHDADNERWRKDFKDKTVFFPDEYDLAVNETLQPDEKTFVLSMNGYSSLTEEFLAPFEIPVGAYEEACEAIFRNAVIHLTDKFSGVRLATADGASDMGVDQGIKNALRSMLSSGNYDHIPNIGFSCPEYLPYVADGDGFPVFLGEGKEDYSHKYIKTLDLLIVTGGREHAFKMDTVASVLYDTRMHFVDVLSELSKNGDVPAKFIDKNGTPQIQNAAAAMGKLVTYYDRSESRLLPNSQDRWDHIFENVGNVATQVCRQKMPVGYRFK